MTPPESRVSSLFIYPVKSTRAHAVDLIRVTARGLEGDRRWVVADPDGQLLSQRDHPTLALVEARPAHAGELILRAPDRRPLRLAPPPRDGPRRAVQIWGDACAAVAAPEEASAWLADYLGVPCQLAYQPDATKRPVDPAFGQAGDHVSFADGYPLLVAGEASLADLNRRLAEPLPMKRFRPNLVVSGAAAFAEDGWKRIACGEVTLRVVKGCARCMVTTIDPETAAVGAEPLRTLATFRKRDDKVYFGQNAIPEGEGLIRVGDPVRVLDPS